MSLRWQKTENPIILKNWSKLIKRCFNCQNFKRGRETIFVPCNLCQLISKDLLTIHRLASIHHSYKHPYNIQHYIHTMHTCFFRPSPPTPTQLLLAAEVVEVKFDKLFTIYHNQPVQCSPQSHVDPFYRSSLWLHHTSYRIQDPSDALNVLIEYLLACLHVPVTNTVLLLDLTWKNFIGSFRIPSMDCLSSRNVIT